MKTESHAPRRLHFNRFEGKPLPPGSRLVTRPGPFGNPFPVKDHGHEEAVRLFAGWLHEPGQAALRERVRRELRGLDLACSCKPGQTCHADALLELANEAPDGRKSLTQVEAEGVLRAAGRESR